MPRTPPPDRAEYAKDVLGYEKGSTDYRDVLADPDVDIVSICAPNLLHKEIGIAAAKAGKPFWIEKPVGRDAVDTAAVADAAREAGVATSIGYNYRHAPAVERIRELIANGELGRITNVRAVFFNGYASEPNGALSWRFKKDLAGSGALGDLLSHVVDLMQYVVGPITDVNGLLSTIHKQRPILPMGQATHFAVIEDGELGDVENDDYAAALVRFAEDSPGAGAVGTLEASRVIVGPQCGLGFEIYGTEGSAAWNFEQMNELKLAIGRKGPSQGYTTILGNSSQGDYAAFQPGPGNSMGYDDLKVIEAKKFLVAVTGGEQRNSTIEEALADAVVITADRRVRRRRPVAQGAAGRRGHLRSPPAPGSRQCLSSDLPVVVGLGVVDPDLVNPVLGGHCRFVAQPTDADLAQAQGAIARADAVLDRDFLARTPRLRVIARTGVGVEKVDLDAATARGIAVVITPGSGTNAVAEGAIAMAMHLVKRFGRLTTLVRDGQWADPRHRLGRRPRRRGARRRRLRPDRATRRRTRRRAGYAGAGLRPGQRTARPTSGAPTSRTCSAAAT